MERISTLDLNNVMTALVCRSIVLSDKAAVVDAEKTAPFGEGVKMVSHRILKPKLLSLAERDEVAIKYKSGMSMTAIANQYGCHYTTIGQILRKNDVKIR